jgi:NADPH-dependent 2,4-dienoyl-CoA reductase/sulfur reductase-like enzyme/nitrite reductase/ring-hydroxylating ferredoxin subunit
MGGSGSTELKGPDLAAGVDGASIPEGGALLGHAGGEQVVLVKANGELCAVGATCTHYGGPLAEGIVSGGTIRCPWHHARYDLRTGDNTRPGRDPIACYRVVREGARVKVGPKLGEPTVVPPVWNPSSVVIVGGGAAGNACALELRRRGYRGPVAILSAEEAAPVDRPNLSKDYLAGTAPEEWVPLRSRDFYSESAIELITGVRVQAIDAQDRRVSLTDGSRREYGELVLATGAEPVKLSIPGGERARVLRSFADSRSIIAAAESAKRAVVVGASFIGLEVAAALRARKVEVAVVAPEARPLERVLGPELGDFVRKLHEEHGVKFHLGHTLKAIEPAQVTLDDGSTLPADLVVAGVGVKPRLQLAEAMGLEMDRGVVVDEELRTSTPHVWAAGDIARWPDRRAGRIRVEHWVVAERQGQTVARNMLGQREAYRAVPFFWSQHYDIPIAYVGHAEKWDRVEVRGSIDKKDCVVAYRGGGRVLAVASIFRDRESLLCEDAMERGDDAALEKVLASV